MHSFRRIPSTFISNKQPIAVLVVFVPHLYRDFHFLRLLDEDDDEKHMLPTSK